MLVLFICFNICIIYIIKCIRKSNAIEQNSQELNDMQQQQENPDIFSQTRPSQHNSRIATPVRPEFPPNPCPGASVSAFLPYPNTGTAYQAPSTNPV